MTPVVLQIGKSGEEVEPQTPIKPGLPGSGFPLIPLVLTEKLLTLLS
jgi:hypothetical protein